MREGKACIITAFAHSRSVVDAALFSPDCRLNHPRFNNRSSVPNAPLSACPGLLRIVPARDGGICRIRLPGGRLTAMQARVVAAGAAQCGSNIIEITNRANLQLRGIDGGRAEALIDALLAAGLGPQAPGGDDVRNVLLSPTAGVDVDMILDTRPVAMRILSLLQTRPELHALSPKFSMSLDGGERTMALAHAHDIWLSALPDGARLAFGFAGCAPRAADDAPALAAVPRAHVLELVEAILYVFLEMAQPGQVRMRDLLAAVPAAEFLRRVRQRLSCSLPDDVSLSEWRRAVPRSSAHIGIHVQRDASLCYVGASPILGRIDAAQLHALADVVDEYGGELRFAPQQSVLLVGIAVAAAPAVADRMRRIGLSCDARALLAHTIACSGAVGCAKGRADTKRDALRLVEQLEPRMRGMTPSIHLAGCERGCAAAQRAEFTLLAQAPERYALYWRADGTAGFGRLLAESADIATVGALIAAHFSEPDA